MIVTALEKTDRDNHDQDAPNGMTEIHELWLLVIAKLGAETDRSLLFNATSRKIYRPEQCSDFGTATLLISDSTDRSYPSTSTRQIPVGYIYLREFPGAREMVRQGGKPGGL
jgi:hypothetical protein